MSTGSAPINSAAAILLSVVCLLASETETQVRAAEDFLKKGDYRSAIVTLNRIIITAPAGDPEVYLMLAVSKLNLEDRQGALDAAEAGLKQFPNSTRIAGYYTSLLPTILPGPQVVKHLEAMLAEFPDSALLRKSLGKALLSQTEDDPHIEFLLSAASAALPGDAEAQYLYGEWACLHQKEDVCVARLKKSLELSPPGNYPAAVLLNGMIATAEDRIGNAAEARKAFEQAFAAYLKLDPAVADVPFQFVKFLVSSGDSARASTVNSEILKRNPLFGLAHLEQAKFLFREGNVVRAIEEANAALALVKQNKAELRAVHLFLVKANAADAREAEAEAHRRWVDANP